MSDDYQPNGWAAAVVLAIASIFREGHRFLTKDRDANLSAMSLRIREIELQHHDCTENNAILQHKVGRLESRQEDLVRHVAECEEKHEKAEARIASLEDINGAR